MRIVAKIPYKSVSPEVIEEIEHQGRYDRVLQLFLDSATEQIIVVC